MPETLNISELPAACRYLTATRQSADLFQTRNQSVMYLQVRSGLVGRWFCMVMGLFSFIAPALIYLWGGHLR